MRHSDMTPLNGFMMIPLDLIEYHPLNIREHLVGIDELTASIKANGLLQPLWVMQAAGGKFTVLEGHRRLTACRKANLYAAPCQLMSHKDAKESLALMLASDTLKVKFTPLERARAYKDLVRLYGSQAAVARETGLTQAAISSALSIFELSPDELAAMERGELSMGEAKRRAHIVRGSKTKDTGWYFSKTHELFDVVKATCTHPDRRQYGHAGCGKCWDEAIRADERSKR